MSKHLSESCGANEHGRCDSKIRKTVPIVTASNTKASTQWISRCGCMCHSASATTYRTRDGRTVSLSTVKA